MNRRLLKFTLACATAALMSCAAKQTGDPIVDGQPVAGGIGNVTALKQGWTTNTQQSFYFETQGSRIMPYEWYLHLEQADSQTLFRDNANIERLNYLPAMPYKKWNPDGLAVGFAKDIDPKTKEAWVGLNCSACHTGQIRYNGVDIRIDGGQTLGDFQNFNDDLVAALSATLTSENKRKRFYTNILGENYSQDAAEALRKSLEKQTAVLHERNKVNRPHKTQPDYGYGRVDAIGRFLIRFSPNSPDLPKMELPRMPQFRTLFCGEPIKRMLFNGRGLRPMGR